ncbi:hypothetical protein LJY25_14150 [Hymenobacter sp. BT175]|uniref:Clp protease N-terminal domain-containing protein n=1 Tax=Hymenobacter translucens TaxID=2886507 RepID=UPI001D0E1B97|nr:Clp protease N-terminal domain-containing protein [Hymenobacter translucens]MCC2547595.1 hypothetical protein [Hymenobacter translucens]
MWNPFRRRRLRYRHYSANLRAIIALTRLEAIRLDNDYINHVHFLLAVLADKNSGLYRLLCRQLEASETSLMQFTYELENVVKGQRTSQRGITVEGSLPLTIQMEDALSHAGRIGFELGAKRVEASHVALGMCQDTTSMGAALLSAAGLSVEMLREAENTAAARLD